MMPMVNDAKPLLVNRVSIQGTHPLSGYRKSPLVNSPLDTTPFNQPSITIPSCMSESSPVSHKGRHSMPFQMVQICLLSFRDLM